MRTFKAFKDQTLYLVPPQIIPVTNLSIAHRIQFWSHMAQMLAYLNKDFVYF